MSGASDPERDHALEEYKNKLLESREWEAKLKALRLEIKGLQRDFDVSEENIKALQSVGQIIGEVLKQLDDERCTSELTIAPIVHTHMADRVRSYRQSLLRTSIRCWLQIKGGQGETQTRDKSGSGHDDAYNHADAASRG